MDIIRLKKAAFYIFIVTSLTACKKEDNTKPGLRSSFNASTLTSTTPYSSTFVNAEGSSTVDFSSGNNRFKMFQALNTYINLNKTQVISADVSKNIYSNTGNPFTATIHPDFDILNATGFNLRNATASSLSDSDAATVRQKIEADLSANAIISPFFNVTASQGVAGKLGSYIVDAKGIEVAQVIQKGLIGAFQLDYIGNVLLNTGLQAENYTVISGKTYTQLEQNWDAAYGALTLNPIIYTGYTASTRPAEAAEFGLGAYVWEYNKENYSNIYLAFLKGRAAIVNNNSTELQTQATFIRNQFEIAIANAALGYLTKWGTGTTDAARAHAIGEGLGFIYALRFCKLNGVSAQFSDSLITGLTGSANGFWDLTPAKISTASTAIKTQFKID